jgi:hypothetical protein
MATKAKRKKPKAKADVENYRHEEAKRKNIPTAENQKLVADEDRAVKKLRWKRNPDLDPQLVWRGKDFEADPLEVDAPPIYIQEKIQPRAIIEDVRKQSKERTKNGAPQFDFFHDFNGLPEGWKEDATQSYYHDEGNWQNRMILGDSLLVMASLAEREGLRGKVQCIYFDPPYGIKFNSNWQPSTKSKDVRDGQQSAVSREPEVIRAFRDTWKDGVHSYVSYLRDRVIAARDLLSERGSIFVQIGDENVHLARSILDEIFGSENFVSLISVSKTAGATAVHLEAFTGKRTRGWMSPGWSETFDTLDHLRSVGVEYVSQWVIDDIPTRLTTKHGDIISIPYGLDLNDSVIYAIEKHSSPEMKLRFEQAIKTFERETRETGQPRVLTIPLHPHLSGVAHRINFLTELIDQLRDRSDTVFVNGSKLTDWYLSQQANS